MHRVPERNVRRKTGPADGFPEDAQDHDGRHGREPRAEDDGHPEPENSTALRPRHEPQARSQEDGQRDELHGQRREGNAHGQRGQDDGGPSRCRRATEGQDHQRGERQRLQEDIEVQRGEREPAQGIDDARQAGARGFRAESAGEGIGSERGQGQVQGEQPGNRGGTGEERVQQVRGIEHGQDERALVDVGVPEGEAAGRELAGGEETQRVEGDAEIAEVVGAQGEGGGQVGEQGDEGGKPGGRSRGKGLTKRPAPPSSAGGTAPGSACRSVRPGSPGPPGCDDGAGCWS